MTQSSPPASEVLPHRLASVSDGTRVGFRFGAKPPAFPTLSSIYIDQRTGSSWIINSIADLFFLRSTVFYVTHYIRLSLARLYFLYVSNPTIRCLSPLATELHQLKLFLS